MERNEAKFRKVWGTLSYMKYEETTEEYKLRMKVVVATKLNARNESSFLAISSCAACGEAMARRKQTTNTKYGMCHYCPIKWPGGSCTADSWLPWKVSPRVRWLKAKSQFFSRFYARRIANMRWNPPMSDIWRVER